MFLHQAVSHWLWTSLESGKEPRKGSWELRAICQQLSQHHWGNEFFIPQRKSGPHTTASPTKDDPQFPEKASLHPHQSEHQRGTEEVMGAQRANQIARSLVQEHIPPHPRDALQL